MATRKALEARQKRILRDLLKKDGNRYCVNCDCLGPQYVVSAFNVFVCTNCSGVHREFGHRVKGVGLCSFPSEELRALQEGGNDVFMKRYGAKLPTDFCKPTDRNHQGIKQWIEDVYISRKYFEEIESTNHDGFNIAESSTDDISVIPLSEILGSNTPILKLSSIELPSSSATEGSCNEKTATTGESEIKEPVEPKSEEVQPEALLGDWDPFGLSSKTAADRIPHGGITAEEEKKNTKESPVEENWFQESCAEPTFEDQWAVFVEDAVVPPVPVHPNRPIVHPVSTAIPNTLAMIKPIAQEKQEQEGDTQEEKEYAVGSIDISVHEEGGKKLKDYGVGSHQGFTQVPSSSRPEVPIDVFFPEFSEIRRTGRLPDGRLLPGASELQFKVPQATNDFSSSYVTPKYETPTPTPSYQHTTSFVSAVSQISPEEARRSEAEVSSGLQPYTAQQHATQGLEPVPTSVIRDEISEQIRDPGILRNGYSGATKTLYGHTTELTAYDFTAPSAPKANTTGNPFA